MDRHLVSSGSPYEQTIGSSRALRVGDHVFVAGTAPVWPDGQVHPDPGVQARRCWQIALAALAELGGGPRPGVGRVRPVSTMVVVAGLLDPRWRCEVELDAVLPGHPDTGPAELGTGSRSELADPS